MNKCGNCEYLVDAFGNYVECVKLHRFVDYEYWNNTEVDDCPISKEETDD